MSLRPFVVPYALAGGLAAVVDLGGFHLLAPRFGGVLWPAALSFAAAAVVNYLLSSLWVYRRDWRSTGRALRFMAVACMGLAINSGTTWVMAMALPATLAKACGIGVAFSANFVMNTWLVFNLSEPRQSSP